MREYKESATQILEEIYDSTHPIEPLFPDIGNVSDFSYYLNEFRNKPHITSLLLIHGSSNDEDMRQTASELIRFSQNNLIYAIDAILDGVDKNEDVVG